MELDLKKNLGNRDRVIRVIVGLLLLGLVFAKVMTGWWAAAAGLLAVFQFLEAYYAY